MSQNHDIENILYFCNPPRYVLGGSGFRKGKGGKMKRITEKALLDGYIDCTDTGTKISEVSGVRIWWDYRTGDTGDGYNCVTDRARADEITLEYGRVGRIEIDRSCDTHSSLTTITEDETTLWGTAVRS